MKSTVPHEPMSPASPRFTPGFRLSVTDVFVLFIGAVAAVLTAGIDRPLAAGIGLAVGHFFLFCNVLRMNRALELIWAGVFVTLVALTRVTPLTWPVAYALATALTPMLAVIQMRKPSYHGVGWRQINPGLSAWWARQLSRERLVAKPSS